jgi:hypothetical protein
LPLLVLSRRFVGREVSRSLLVVNGPNGLESKLLEFPPAQLLLLLPNPLVLLLSLLTLSPLLFELLPLLLAVATEFTKMIKLP